jgi:hypothetical protein
MMNAHTIGRRRQNSGEPEMKEGQLRFGLFLRRCCLRHLIECASTALHKPPRKHSCTRSTSTVSRSTGKQSDAMADQASAALEKMTVDEKKEALGLNGVPSDDAAADFSAGRTGVAPPIDTGCVQWRLCSQTFRNLPPPPPLASRMYVCVRACVCGGGVGGHVRVGQGGECNNKKKNEKDNQSSLSLAMHFCVLCQPPPPHPPPPCLSPFAPHSPSIVLPPSISSQPTHVLSSASIT